MGSKLTVDGFLKNFVTFIEKVMIIEFVAYAWGDTNDSILGYTKKDVLRNFLILIREMAIFCRVRFRRAGCFMYLFLFILGKDALRLAVESGCIHLCTSLLYSAWL